MSRKSRVKSPAFLMLILKEAQIIVSDTLVKLVEKFAPLPFGVYLQRWIVNDIKFIKSVAGAFDMGVFQK